MAWGSFGILSWGEKVNSNPYTEVSTDPDVEGDAPHEDLLNESVPTACFSCHSVPDCILAISVILLIVASGMSVASEWHPVTDAECDSTLRAFTPLANAIEYDWVQLGDGSMPSMYKGSPTAEIEKAWNDLWDYGAFNVPLEKLTALNKSSLDGDFRLVGSEHGGGVAGLLEGFHQIHCLNLIRQYIYRDQWDYSHVPSFGGGPRTRRHHVDHCIETTRMNLMCLGDVTPYLVESDPAMPNGVVPKFNGLHKCRNYGKLIDWVKGNVVFSTVAED